MGTVTHLHPFVPKADEDIDSEELEMIKVDSLDGGSVGGLPLGRGQQGLLGLKKDLLQLNTSQASREKSFLQPADLSCASRESRRPIHHLNTNSVKRHELRLRRAQAEPAYAGVAVTR